jgi:hypothetical protein
VLHRDIKPANCFTDRDGTVKIGDFGLSISTLARDVTQLTTSGTPGHTAVCVAGADSRRAARRARRHLLGRRHALPPAHGRPPFDDKELLRLVTRIGTGGAVAADGPAGRAVCARGRHVRCLAKDRAARLPIYAELTDRLRPFSSTAPTSATLGRRVLANIVDRQSSRWRP